MEKLMHLLAAHEREEMLRITTQKKRGKTVLSIEGRLAGPLVGTLEQCWRELHATSPTERVHLGLCGGTFMDAAGRGLLKGIYRGGGGVGGGGGLDQAIVWGGGENEKK